MAHNPYADLPDERFWRRAVAGVPPFALDPRPAAPFPIAPTDRVATAGSCFAQRVAQALRDAGYHYYITEAAPPGLAPEEAEARQYGTYSARYGNLYTPRQFVQLFDRAYGAFVPALQAWPREDGRFVDPFRPTIEPAGFADPEAVAASRAAHLARVRALFESLDVFVLTLGQTEGWRHREDGAALPLAPGVAGGIYDPDAYMLVNAGAAEATADLRGFLDRLRGVNPAARVIVTVSPVPMIATGIARHVLVSNTYTKAVLRVAAEEAIAGDAQAVYFPSYEIVTGGQNAARYYAEDQRSVTPAGIRHVMRCFLAAFTPGGAAPPEAVTGAEFARTRGVVCDEEEIERSLA
ncbi:GSCFA domain-containing protein [Methylobacterium nodulans]|uniref:GSCFA domain protein n=1 Tax=Methylobacterium nodulans (strain LMG 21967 / CNCM I-2342 / ORS 2060) TaxID=460265 RepID=B8IP12_METNO|nr:GSCFA domain-containing protein [Methylobacterium nodulans]ACL60330.1 GSCFA domain protein [Methylobacterium nodulans ORS 2060]